MSPLLHDVPPRPCATVERCTIGRNHLPARGSRIRGESPLSPSPLDITVRFGAAAQVGGAPTGIGQRRLDTLLNSQIAVGSEEVTVHLGGAGMVDAAPLQVLRAAQARLAGRLTVIGDRAETRFQLMLVGLDGWLAPGEGFPSAGASHAHR